jgi:hypothetical protein
MIFFKCVFAVLSFLVPRKSCGYSGDDGKTEGGMSKTPRKWNFLSD